MRVLAWRALRRAGAFLRVAMLHYVDLSTRCQASFLSAAGVQDRDTLPALDAGKACWPSLREAIYDGAFSADRCREWSNLHGMHHRVVQRPPSRKGFVVLERRCVV